MNRTERPPARTARTKRNTFSVSVSDSAVVGSSITIRSRLVVDGARERDALPLAARELADDRVGREHFRGEADLAHQPLGLGALALAVEKAERIGQFAAEEDVARDRLLHAERAVLEHGLDAGVARARGVPVRLALAAHQDFAARRLDRAGEHLDQRRFAGAVVAERPTTSPRSTWKLTPPTAKTRP